MANLYLRLFPPNSKQNTYHNKDHTNIYNKPSSVSLRTFVENQAIIKTSNELIKLHEEQLELLKIRHTSILQKLEKFHDDQFFKTPHMDQHLFQLSLKGLFRKEIFGDN